MSVCGEQHFRQEISSLWVITLFYGLYVALFGGSIYVLINRRRNTYFLCTSIALFMLTTAYMATSLATILATPIEVSNSYSTSTAVLSCTAETPERLNEVVIGNLTSVVQSSLTACMNLISGSVLVYRCMALWPQRRGIAVPLGFMLLASTALGFACVYLQEQEYIIRKDAPLTETVPPPRWIELGIDYDDLHNVSNVLNTIVDSVATVIVASRIWYLARQLESTLGQKAGLRYRAAVSMFIESGILIMMSEVLTTVLGFVAHTGTTFDVFDLVSSITLMLIVIAPTLIIVRVGMRKGFDSVVETTHELHASRGAQVRSIEFVERRTADMATNIINFPSLGVVPQNNDPESDGQSRSMCGHSGLSVASGQRECIEEKSEMTEVKLDVV